MKKNLKYVVFILVVSCFIFAGNLGMGMITEYITRTFKKPIFLYWFISTAIYISFGGLMGVPHYMGERIKEGKWRINLSKLLIIGIPSLVFAYAYYFILVSTIPLPKFLSVMVRILLAGKNTHSLMFKILLGYTLVTSFYKKEETKKHDNCMAYREE